ncbi:MAG TPA: PAS domain-containing protein, partial [Vicinamibacterales bacterium]|nr:PAS domain-containing protein [Vicinamibacterales bacterium]
MWVALPAIVVAAGALVVIILLERARRHDRLAAARWAMISRVSALLAEILHADTTLEDVVRLLVPQFADWCAVHLVEEAGIRRAAVVHADPDIERRLRKRFAEMPFIADASLGPAKVIRTGEFDLLEQASGESLAGQGDPELLQTAGFGSRISVPLRLRQQTFGALSLHRKAPHAYDRGDIEWAQDLAQRIALAIEAARLYADARRLFEQSASANWVLTPDGRILACNRMFAQLLGFGSIEEALGAPAADLFVDPTECQRLLKDITVHRHLSNREALFKRRDDGRLVHALVTAASDVDQGGRLRRVIGFIIDHSALKSLEAQLRQSQRLEAVGQLAGGIAHDFNNLLTVIIGCADVIAADDGRPRPRGGHDPLEELTKAARSAADLTKQLLAFSRRQVLQPRLVDLNDALRSTHAMLRRLVRENIAIVLNLDPRIPPVRVDPGQLDQVIVNLVVNAADALPQGGTITLTAARTVMNEGSPPDIAPGDYVVLTVRDNGIGMDEETLSRAFEPFFTTKPLGK